ncbi:hypothetical protein [Streptomyces sp. NPDC002328]|uniref:hypothetical protein n=1 Tax=Streptomyces sp. NPDC002328 TaxID=3364642 RepID=UPI003676E92E
MTVRLRHPELPDSQTIDVAESAVPVHRAAGWVLVEDDAPEPSTDSPEAEPADEADTPSPTAARKRRRTTEGE